MISRGLWGVARALMALGAPVLNYFAGYRVNFTGPICAGLLKNQAIFQQPLSIKRRNRSQTVIENMGLQMDVN